MNRDQIKQLYPNASESFIRANCTLPSRGDSPAVTVLRTAEQGERPAALARDCAPEAQGTRCPCVCFTLRRVQLLDVDAKYGAIKDLLDGLAIAGLIPGDKEGQIRLGVEQIRVAKYAEEGTEISITYP